jgi:hypothetical protein
VHQYYVTPDGRKLPVPANSQAVDRLRGELTATRFQTWEERQRVFYSPYSTKPAGHYRDPYHERFDYWLWNQPVEIQAQWYYHHHGIMAQERFLAGLAHDPRVKARVADLERQRLALNAAFVPPGLPARELMFNGGFVAAVYQDTKAQANAQWLWTVGQVGMLLSLGVLVVWVAFLFWGSEPKPPEVLDFGPQGVSR